jgi:hypothetical protein
MKDERETILTKFAPFKVHYRGLAFPIFISDVYSSTWNIKANIIRCFIFVQKEIYNRYK